MPDMHDVRLNVQEMDAWQKYNMARFRFGLDAELDPRQLALASQANDKSICNALGEIVVSLHRRDAQGGLHRAATGFFVIQNKGIVVTAKHSLPTGGDQLVAYFANGTSEDAHILATDINHDIAVLQVNQSSTMPTLRRGTAHIGDTVYVMGFPSDKPNLNFTKGIVSSTASDGMFITTAYADNGERSWECIHGNDGGCMTKAKPATVLSNASPSPPAHAPVCAGFSGGPVVNLHMELVGMVRGGAGYVQGVTNQQVSCITADLLDGFTSGILAMRR